MKDKMWDDGTVVRVAMIHGAQLLHNLWLAELEKVAVKNAGLAEKFATWEPAWKSGFLAAAAMLAGLRMQYDASDTILDRLALGSFPSDMIESGAVFNAIHDRAQQFMVAYRLTDALYPEESSGEA